MRSVVLKRQPVETAAADPLTGLTCREAEHRFSCGWHNRVPSKNALTAGRILKNHFLTFFNLLFLVMALVLAICGSSIKNMTFMIVVAINAVIGCVQQLRAKRALDKLTLVAAQTVTCIRDGRELLLGSDLLVRDDIVCFGTGDQLCADGILRTGCLQVNEALLTGEEQAITKVPGDPLLSGSFVVAGSGRAQLTRVGPDTFAARLAAEAKKDPRAARSEMMLSLDKLIRTISFLLLPMGLLLFFHEFYRLHNSVQISAEATVAALVGMIPQGLYLLTSVALAASSLKLSQKRVLVKDMNCIENLARADVLCVDKTGTITEPDMQVENLIPLADGQPEAVLAALYGSREPDNPTARAICQYVSGHKPQTCGQYLPFTSDSKWCGGSLSQGCFLAGAPEVILSDRYAELQEQTEAWTGRGCRVLLVAGYRAAALPVDRLLDAALVDPLALLVLRNRIRPDAPDTFAYFARQGVAIKVISGDNPVTVSHIAQQAGIPNAGAYTDASTLSAPEDYLTAAETYTVFGRVTPEQKKLLIQALKQRGHTVAMTGDGVNDVLALKEADCGIAMAAGAKAAGQVAHLVLLDNNFSAIPGIMDEGRRVINNIQRAASLFLMKNILSLALTVFSLLLGQTYPFAPLHLTLISALTIGAPSFFLALEPSYQQIRGQFLPTVLRKALPGAFANILLIVLAQKLLKLLQLSRYTSTVCTAVLAVVGLMVLFQVCKPFTPLRKAMLGAMAAGILICFLFLRGFFDLKLAVIPFLPALLIMLIVAPVLLLGLEKLTALIAKRFKSA